PRKALVCNGARVIQSGILENVLSRAGGAHGLAVEDGHFLKPLRHDLATILKLDLERPRTAYPVPLNLDTDD
ncbi:MAG TPA: hypothetical protein VLY63_21840, partial [Anaerolineae bacterium]|nr:hypothetical protein [Anaerolineae bacterium]